MFENIGKLIQDEALLRHLREVTKIDGLDIDTMRSVDISHFYNNFNMTYAEKRELARKMRNSVEVQQHKYVKVVEKTETDKAKDERIKDLEEQVKELVCKNEELKNSLTDVEDKLKDFKGENSKTQEWKKRRYDVIFKLSSNRQKNVKESTLEKFDIKYNSETNKYY